jgi:hypothetical protein
MERMRLDRVLLFALLAAAVSASPAVSQSTIDQDSSWTINKPGATTTYRVVAYGDSLFAGHYGELFSVAKRAAPYVAGEYAVYAWNSNVEIVRRTRAGAKADDIYNNKILAERSYMQDSSTRVVMFDMCGNDALEAQVAFANETGTCNYTPLNNALSNCTTYVEKAMQAINQYARTAKVKMVTNLYYLGYEADNQDSSCEDGATGQPVNLQGTYLPYVVKGNWRVCNLAAQYGFACADSFAQFMGADYDSNGDGLVDSEGLAYRAGESEADYVTRITSTLRSTIQDPHDHLINATTSYDYILSDDIHPTFYGGETIDLDSTGSGSGSGPPDFGASQIVGGKNPVWNQYGHERMGWALSVFASANGTPQPTLTPTPTSTPTTLSTCVGDCDGTGAVAVNNIITLVNIALGNAQPPECARGIPTGAQVDIGVILHAVKNALYGCGGHAPTPTPRPSCVQRFDRDTPESAECVFAGSFNTVCGGGNNLGLFVGGSGGLMAAGLNEPFVEFGAQVTSPTSADIYEWGTQPDWSDAQPASGIITLDATGTVLTIAPTTVLFTIGGCEFQQYAGTYIGTYGTLGGTAAAESDTKSRLRAILDPVTALRSRPPRPRELPELRP